jgi:hypothetical protein
MEYIATLYYQVSATDTVSATRCENFAYYRLLLILLPIANIAGPAKTGKTKNKGNIQARKGDEARFNLGICFPIFVFLSFPLL